MHSEQKNTKGKVLSKGKLHTFLAKDFYHKHQEALILFFMVQPTAEGYKCAPCWFGEN